MLENINKHEVFLSLGSNLENPLQQLKIAINYLESSDLLYLHKVSSIYKTAPIGYEDQPEFLNCVVSIKTALKPITLLNYLLNIEQDMGRIRENKWGPRKIDIDILLYDDIDFNNELLKIPHPQLTKRAFVLVPLSEIAGDVIIYKKNLKYYISKILYFQKITCVGRFS